MPNDPLADHIERMIEALIAQPDEDSAAVASLLMAARAAHQRGVATNLTLAAWEFLEAHRVREATAMPASRP